MSDLFYIVGPHYKYKRNEDGSCDKIQYFEDSDGNHLSEKVVFHYPHLPYVYWVNGMKVEFNLMSTVRIIKEDDNER